MRLNHAIRPDTLVQLRLQCKNRVTTQSGKSSSTSEHLIWEHETTVKTTLDGTAIPVAIALLPADDAEPTTSWFAGANGILWKLKVDARQSWISYKAEFAIPVIAGEIMPEKKTLS